MSCMEQAVCETYGGGRFRRFDNASDPCFLEANECLRSCARFCSFVTGTFLLTSTRMSIARAVDC